MRLQYFQSLRLMVLFIRISLLPTPADDGTVQEYRKSTNLR
jgi:hypothetical protein